MRLTHLNKSPLINCDRDLSSEYCGNNTREGILLLRLWAWQWCSYASYRWCEPSLRNRESNGNFWGIRNSSTPSWVLYVKCELRWISNQLTRLKLEMSSRGWGFASHIFTHIWSLINIANKLQTLLPFIQTASQVENRISKRTGTLPPSAVSVEVF